MASCIEEDNLVFSFHLIQLSQVDYQLFLSSDKAGRLAAHTRGHGFPLVLRAGLVG